MENPSKLEEGGVTYSLGTFDGKQVFYDFPKILVFLEAKGKRLFGVGFTLQEKDWEMLLKLSNYFIRDLENCEKDGIDPDKGILLSGPVGSGKTCLMKLMRHIAPHQRQYEVIPSRNIAFSLIRWFFNLKGNN